MTFPDRSADKFPVANAVPSFWRNQAGPIDDHRSTEDLSSSADIVIIGAGYTGASVVHHILEQSAQYNQTIPSILILEAREACSGATGRNGGHLKPDPIFRASSVLETHGKEVAEHVSSFEARQVDAIKDLVQRKNIDCDFEETKVNDVCFYNAGRDQIKATLTKLVNANITTAKQVEYHSARGSVKTNAVVYATNGYTSALVPEMKDKIVPVRGMVARLTGANVPKLKDSYLMRFSDHEYDYMIPRPDGSIVLGGARRDFFKDLDEWFDVADDSKVMEGARGYFDGYMQRHFAGWEDSGFRTEEIWTGIMGYSNDGFPYVGPIRGRAGQYMCAGFTGHGMPQIFLSAKAVASMILIGDTEVDLPLPYRISQARWSQPKAHASLEAWQRFRDSELARAVL
ncbi:hypothetical protein E8E12_005513 [Didymella heteroderae]|uniref:FAD dependent oxidoreductase domain-containing protein n=1 Tax=Didymella heteroderae TaxID=1769908 RepID=A0A9P5BXZ4_9PLEO|nr:hypothetical protein E8E12_005513 [Didymella heteroderae]